MLLALSGSLKLGLNERMVEGSDGETQQAAVQKMSLPQMLLLLILLVLPIVLAVSIAVQCNPSQKWLYGIVAFLFPEIYLAQWGVRKYVLKQSSYCNEVKIQRPAGILITIVFSLVVLSTLMDVLEQQ